MDESYCHVKSGPRAKQAGFTAVELIVVLIVALGILALSAGKIEMLFEGSDVTAEVSASLAIAGNVRSLKTRTGYGAVGRDLTADLAASKGVPMDVSVVSGVIYNAWKGTVVPRSTGTGFTVTYSAVPQAGCIRLATKTSASGAYQTTAINGGTPTVGEVSAAAAQSQCVVGTNTMVFTSVN